MTTLYVQHGPDGIGDMLLEWNSTSVPSPDAPISSPDTPVPILLLHPRRKKPGILSPIPSPDAPVPSPDAPVPSPDAPVPSPDAPVPILLLRPRRKKPVMASSYSSDQIPSLSDDLLMASFIRITGRDTLYCSHCRRATAIEERWMYSIRKRCSKYGLYPENDISIPKTCNIQLKNNERCSAVNNIAYNTLRRANVSDSEKQRLLEVRQEKIKEMGIQPKPRKYLV
jgi:hypothetical protein